MYTSRANANPQKHVKTRCVNFCENTLCLQNAQYKADNATQNPNHFKNPIKLNALSRCLVIIIPGNMFQQPADVSISVRNNHHPMNGTLW